MAGRPPLLYPLFGDITALPGIGPKSAQALAKREITKPRDVLFVLPHTIVDRRPRATVQGVDLPATVTVAVDVLSHQPPQRRGRPHRVFVQDAALAFQLIYFHARGDYVERQLPKGARRIVSGRAEVFDGVVQMPHPDYAVSEDDVMEIPAFEPIYPLSEGITQKGLSKAVAGALQLVPELGEWIDAGVMAEQGWPGFQAALAALHQPEDVAAAALSAPARERIAYDELFAHQLTLAVARSVARRAPGQVTKGTGRLQARVLGSLDYAPTGAQTRAAQDIAEDMASDRRMNRLLQGDVGSGKTLVAMLALLGAVEAGGQGVMMAPTEILARQHHESLAPLAEAAGLRLEVLTGRDKGAARAEKLAALLSGGIDILVGTHAVFQSDVAFADLRLAIVDEQHRFGVRQRLELGAKGDAVDMLIMTATPIPRSLSLAQYGDMDVSILDEKPPGRMPVKTALSSVDRMAEIVAHLVQAVAEGRQAYWVCPLVEESEVVDLASAEERFKALRASLGDDRVSLVHGQMPTAEKDAAMANFVAGRTSVLVATTVIEVGVNVPNATIMVIERAESFGLAQLHQLRGRVGRGTAASTCLLLFQAPLSESGERRLKILRDTDDGFRIAEEDLALRGAGDMIGVAQSGLPRFRVADLERQAGLMARAQKDARLLLSKDPELTSDRGAAARTLLWLMEQDKAIRLLTVG